MRAAFAKHVVYPLHERLMHRPTFSYLAELEKTQWLSRAEIEQLQLEKLRQLLQIAAAHCPWHARRIREADIDPTRPLTFDDLRRLPTMTKQDAIANGVDLVWRDVPGGVFKYNTGGSSGEPLIFYYGRRRQASDAAGRIRARRWWGVDVGDKEVYLWGAPVELEQDRSGEADPRPAPQPARPERLRQCRPSAWTRIAKPSNTTVPDASTATPALSPCSRPTRGSRVFASGCRSLRSCAPPASRSIPTSAA